MDNQTQTRRRPVIRVFVSSTFTDLKPERDALQREVFPKLEQLCASRQFQFQAIDLRWGVPTEASLDHRTMRICFEELRRSQEISPQPNFLILLGNRYGWRPLPEDISQAEFEKLVVAANSGGENQNPIPGTHGKTALQVFKQWYRCDGNVLVPDQPEISPDHAPLNYILRPRTQNLRDGRDYTRRKDDPTKDTQDWIDVQQVLWRIINAAFPPEALGLRFDIDWAQHVADVNGRQHPKRAIPQIARFQASATEQEIWCGALSVVNAEQHVIACFRDLTNRNEYVPADVMDFFDLTETGEFDAASAKRQSQLKDAIKDRLGDNEPVVIPFSRLKRENGKVVVEASEADTKTFCDSVENRLRPIITRQMDEYWGTSDATAVSPRELELERSEHQRFGQERAANFIGRDEKGGPLERIRDYLNNNSNQPLVIHGASGCGKTALLARAVGEMQKEEGRTQNEEVIVRFIGVTPRSSDVRSLLASLCQELRQRHPLENSIPGDVRELSAELDEHFKMATAQAPLLLFLDALDQLADADNGPSLFWIPQLPGHVKLIVSCLSDRAPEDPAGQPYTALKRRGLPEENFINLDALSEGEAQTLLFERWLPQAGRKLNAGQTKCIRERLKSDACRQPLYLKVLFEEARLWRFDDPAPTLGNNVSELLGALFKRLGDRSNHGPTLECALGYIAAARRGLTEMEILEVLYQDPDYAKFLEQMTAKTGHKLPDNSKRIPIAIWSRLRFDLSPYLAEHAAPGGTVLNFYHRQVAEFASGQFLDTPPKRQRRHERLAGYFVSCAKGSDSAREWETLAVRGFAECIFHLTKAEQHDMAAELLSTFPFLLRKLRVGLLEGVFEDYEIFRHEALAELVKRLEIWADFFREKAHILRRGNVEWPKHKILLQLAAEHADDSPLTIAAEEWLQQDHCDWLWLRRVPRLAHTQKNPCPGVLEGHTREIIGAQALADGRLLSWSPDKTLRLWDGQSGACLEVIAEDQAAQRRPDWLLALKKARNPESVVKDLFADSLARTAHLRHKALSPLLAAWNTNSDASARCLLADGAVVVTQDSGQVCILKLHHGNRRISLAEAEVLLPHLYPASARHDC